MSLFALYRLYRLFTAYVVDPLTFYVRLALSKMFPKQSDSRWQLQRGQGLVEYALVLVMVAVVVIAILTLIGPRVGQVFFNVSCGFDGGEVLEGTLETGGSTYAGLGCKVKDGYTTFYNLDNGGVIDAADVSFSSPDP